eukprot:s132_g21.t1
MAAVAALALVVSNQGEDPEGAAAALQLSVTAPAFQWPGREAALGHQAVLTLAAATRWSVGRCRVSFDARPATDDIPPARGESDRQFDCLVRGTTGMGIVFIFFGGQQDNVELQGDTYEPFGGHEQWDPEWPCDEWGPGENQVWDSEVGEKTGLDSEPYPCDWWGKPADAHTDPEWGDEQWDPEWPCDEWGPGDNQVWDSEVDEKTGLASESYPCDWSGEPVDSYTDPEWGGHEQWDPEWPCDEWGSDENQVWDTEMWGPDDASAEWGDPNEHPHPEECDPNAEWCGILDENQPAENEGTRVDNVKGGNKQPQYYGKDGALLPLKVDDLVIVLREKGCTDRNGVSSFLWDIPHEDYFQLLVEDARQHPAVEPFEAYTRPFTEDWWKFLGDETDEIEDMTDLIFYLVSPPRASFQHYKDHSTTKACMGSSFDEVCGDGGESWDTSTGGRGDIDPENTNPWSLNYEGNDPAPSCLEDLVNEKGEKPTNDPSEHIKVWGDNVVPYEQVWDGWTWGDEWVEPEVHSPFMKEFLGELENELDKKLQPSGASPAEDSICEPFELEVKGMVSGVPDEVMKRWKDSDERAAIVDALPPQEQRRRRYV